jgi:hypothetical protein
VNLGENRALGNCHFLSIHSQGNVGLSSRCCCKGAAAYTEFEKGHEEKDMPCSPLDFAPPTFPTKPAALGRDAVVTSLSISTEHQGLLNDEF